ncbi:MAG TPA: hypothetical protein VEA17_12705 [Bordetella sp.]|nr:hypothetical protein [Bordetella sp.]
MRGDTDNGGAAYACRDAAARAVAMVMPMIAVAMKDPRVGESGFLHIVVMDPAATSMGHAFEDAILYEESVGDRAAWDADYAAYARAKASISWRTGMDSHAVCETRPHLLRPADGTVWGSVCVDGIVVGVSGANPWYDEAFAGAIAHTFKAIAKARRQAG